MTAPFIPQAEPRASYYAHRSEIDAAIAGVLEGGTYVLGDEVRQFEREFGMYHAGASTIGVGNGVDALIIALRACGVGPGDGVITVSHAAVATIAAIEQAGATPILADITRATFTLDTASLEKALHTIDRTSIKAIVPVHLYGHPVDMPSVLALARENEWLVIEDCAQSAGATLNDRRTGTWGDVAAFSFHPVSNLGAIGDGGAVMTSNPHLAERARLIREHGRWDAHVSETAGIHSRLDEIQASILRVKLRHLDASNTRRREIAARYVLGLSGVEITLSPVCDGVSHAYNQFVIRHRDRDGLRTRLKAAGVETLVHYPVPVHLQPAWRGLVQQVGTLRESETAALEVLSLPMFPEMTDEQVDLVVEAVRSCC